MYYFINKLVQGYSVPIHSAPKKNIHQFVLSESRMQKSKKKSIVKKNSMLASDRVREWMIYP